MNREDQLLNRSEIIRMAREAGFSSAVGKHIALDVDLERFFQAAYAAGAAAEQAKFSDDLIEYGKAMAAAEREACAKAVLDDAWALTFQTFGQYRTALAAAIRARSKR